MGAVVSAGRAAGVRRSFAQMPQAVRSFVEETLGSPVTGTREMTGGFSPGCATRVTTADGDRAFVKAVGAELNPDTPTLFRREVLALSRLGRHPLWAGMLASLDHDDWVTIVLEDVEGHTPDLSDDSCMQRLLNATDNLVVAMNERVRPADLPLPGAGVGLFRSGPADLRQVFAEWAASFDRLDDLPDDLLPGWLRRSAPTLRPLVSALTGQEADHVVHWDIRDDNLVERPDGDLVFVDWGAFGIGPAWLDPLLARLERVDRPWFDESLRSSPSLAEAGDDVVTGWLLGMGVHLAQRAHTAVDLNLPTLQAFRRAESARFLDAAGRRLAI